MYYLLVISVAFLIFAVFFAIVAAGVFLTSKPGQTWARIMATLFAVTSCAMLVIAGSANRLYKVEYQAEVTAAKVRSQ